MLEIKNVTKIYNTRNGAQTKALDGVSITFGETGMVFLLGKSGSGKSTLLNVAGGLDEPTSGEIAVRGKSSKTFSGSDFDSYRNTFVGFVFQEYNILDEFDVEDNIALALELQGKPKDREKINGILREVELEQYAKRKPNTLSGGQKQRIAIARALVKDPQIIMADEPTGALDSATGKQVFDTLKMLSKTRLVIVVSHDREFAEIYGDRIVELKDGKIISDVTKTYIPPETVGEDIKVLGGNTLCIKAGQQLTPRHMLEIQQFLNGADGDIIITKGRAETEAFKKSNRMTENGDTEKFEDTNPNSIVTKEYTPEQSAFIRSKLPAGKAIKIGASGLKVKPVRLVFTILLSVIAFIMFGLSSTMMLYDGDSVMTKSFTSSNYDYLKLNKNYRLNCKWEDEPDGESWYETQSAKFTQAELDGFKERYGVNTLGYYSESAEIINSENNDDSYLSYYNLSFNSFASVPADHPLRDTLIGAYPAGKDEICISSYTFESIKNNTFYNIGLDSDGNLLNYNQNDIIKIENERDIIGKLLYLPLAGGNTFKVTGVYKTDDIPQRFDELKTDSGDFLLMYDLMNYLADGLHMTALVADGFAKEYLGKTRPATNPFGMCGEKIRFGENYSAYSVRMFGHQGQLETLFFKDCERTSLADNEAVVNLSVLQTIAEYQEDFATDTDLYVNADDEASRADALSRLRARIESMPAPEITVTINDMREYTFKIAGVYLADVPEEQYSIDGAYFSQNFIDENFELWQRFYTYETKYADEGGIFDGLLVSYDRSASAIRSLLDISGEAHITENDVFYSLTSSLYSAVESANEIISLLSTVFLVAGIIFALFSALLLFNFISVSISNKKKEIGILRAVGARGVDVFKIFFSESGIIVGICTALALIGSAVVCAVLNSVLKVSLGLGVTLFVFGIFPILILIAIAAFVAFISTFLPVYFASRKKPVDSIRSL